MKIDELRNQMMIFRKTGNKNLIVLSTIIGELTSNAKMIDGKKVVTDDEVIAHLKKYVKNLEETLSHKEVPSIREELNYVATLLPKQLSEGELREIWEKFSNLGEYMKHLKENYFGQYDGKVASQIAKGN